MARNSSLAQRAQLVLPFLLVLAMAAGFTLSGARTASAHDALASAVPAADQTVTEKLAQITLTFSETPLADFANAIALEVTAPSGSSAITGPPKAEGTTLTAVVGMTETGPHRVTWQSVSSDGHTIAGTYTFTYAGPLPSTEPTPITTPVENAPPSAATAPDTSETITAASTSSAALPAPSSLPSLITGVTAVAALILIPLIVIHIRRRQQEANTANETDSEGSEK